jgi:tetratricopeptide (TPR) repeat protein
VRRAAILGLIVLLGSGAAAAQSDAQRAYNRAIELFETGHPAESALEFDTVARLDPGEAPYLWQRGIALYYAGRYRDCRAQFESHRRVNPNDVENAVWHFLCVARAESVEKARAAILPVGPDGRVPMPEVYQMFRGTLTPERVLAIGRGNPEAEFFAHLYVGLYYEALGRKADALDQIKTAALERYARAGGYMHLVARVHLVTLR